MLPHVCGLMRETVKCSPRETMRFRNLPYVAVAIIGGLLLHVGGKTWPVWAALGVVLIWGAVDAAGRNDDD